MSVHQHRYELNEELNEVTEMKLTVMKCERLHTRAMPGSRRLEHVVANQQVMLYDTVL